MLIMMYECAEREGDFSLHLHACCKMMVCFFAAPVGSILITNDPKATSNVPPGWFMLPTFEFSR